MIDGTDVSRQNISHLQSMAAVPQEGTHYRFSGSISTYLGMNRTSYSRGFNPVRSALPQCCISLTASLHAGSETDLLF